MLSIGRILLKVSMDEVGGAIIYNVAVQRQEELPYSLPYEIAVF